MPASNWTSPPYANAYPSQALPVEFPFIQCATDAESRNVVRANAASPSGAGSAIGLAADDGAGAVVRSSLTLMLPPRLEPHRVSGACSRRRRPGAYQYSSLLAHGTQVESSANSVTRR